MVIFGVGILAACVLAGRLGGTLIGRWLGIDADVGGIGIAMVLLMVVTTWLRRRGLDVGATVRGIQFWSDVYVPVVVAMAASQNVRLAVASGWSAVLAGGASVALGMLLVPLVVRLGLEKRPAASVSED